MRKDGRAVKVLLLSWNYPPICGGIEHVVDHLFHGLAATGHEAWVITAS